MSLPLPYKILIVQYSMTWEVYLKNVSSVSGKFQLSSLKRFKMAKEKYAPDKIGLKCTWAYSISQSCSGSSEDILVDSAINPIWTGLFAKLKRLGKCPPPNLAISSQMKMKLGTDMLWLEIFTN